MFQMMETRKYTSVKDRTVPCEVGVEDNWCLCRANPKRVSQQFILAPALVLIQQDMLIFCHPLSPTDSVLKERRLEQGHENGIFLQHWLDFGIIHKQ
jgi:hypothetical protein